MQRPNLSVHLLPAADLSLVLCLLSRQYQVKRLTIQSGGRLNGLFLRQKLIDRVDVIVAPLLVGGDSTPTLVDGAAIRRPEELSLLAPLELEACTVLEHSYLRLQYRVRRASPDTK